MSNYLTIPRNYTDNDILFQADLDDICQAIMTFLNTTKLNEDNLSTSITTNLIPSGFILLYGNATAPTNWLNCDGSVVSQTTYAALYAVVGTAYNTGGEGAGNFRLPDFRRRVPVGAGGTGTSVLGNAVGNLGGEEQHTLASDVSTLPSHTHSDSTGHSHPETALSRNYTAGTSALLAGNATSGGIQNTVETTALATATYNQTGGGGGHDNVQPSLVMNFIIKT